MANWWWAALLWLAAVVPQGQPYSDRCVSPGGTQVACGPGQEVSGPAFPEAERPRYHLMDNHNEENDPNGPFFDPVHGVFHLFYQVGRGPSRVNVCLGDRRCG